MRSILLASLMKFRQSSEKSEIFWKKYFWRQVFKMKIFCKTFCKRWQFCLFSFNTMINILYFKKYFKYRFKYVFASLLYIYKTFQGANIIFCAKQASGQKILHTVWKSRNLTLTKHDICQKFCQINVFTEELNRKLISWINLVRFLILLSLCKIFREINLRFNSSVKILIWRQFWQISCFVRVKLCFFHTVK